MSSESMSRVVCLRLRTNGFSTECGELSNFLDCVRKLFTVLLKLSSAKVYFLFSASSMFLLQLGLRVEPLTLIVLRKDLPIFLESRRLSLVPAKRL